MFVIYAKDEDYNIACSARYQQVELLGVYSTMELVHDQINAHKLNIQERRQNEKICTPKYWGYYIYLCELNEPAILDEKNVYKKM
jgi:hypothetical protein